MQASHHDTSTQAMTEVALGVSMAFFSLLILALFSIGLPEQAIKNQLAEKQPPPLPLGEQIKLVADGKTTQSKKVTTNKQQQYAFYYNGQFYNQQSQPLKIEGLANFSSQDPLILAVQDSLPIAQVMALRTQISHPNLSITMLNKTWQIQLEKMQ